MNNTIPKDVYNKNMFRDKNFILVKDPKHSNENFHFTIWCIDNIVDISEINQICINNLKNFIEKIKKLELFTEEKMYFCYPPTFNRLHLHIVKNNYISYRPLNELYYFDDINNININLEKVKIANKVKTKDPRIRIGIIVINNIYLIRDSEKVKSIIYESIQNLNKEKCFFLIINRKKLRNIIEKYINDFKCINIHIISKNINNFEKMIKYDNIIYI